MYITYILIAMPKNFKAGTDRPHGIGAARQTAIPAPASRENLLVDSQFN
jgi:hypothetical protein